MKPIIEVNHVWKEYHKGIDRRYKSLRDTLIDMPKKLFGAEKEKFWALEDIDFKVEAGESVGIIGRNGAGKSTLLKILSRITPPTRGEIILRGRVASLLEVGTGFHPELTGRENVFFNGSILGMKNQEIKRKFDEIVDFSGVENFIDTPLKHYSSGMQMRLAFSVAAHLDSEILLIDEVLAVGDAEFQKKCIGKMDDVSKGEGKTILFVSHDLSQIKNLCKKGVFIQNGALKEKSTIDIVLEKYLKFNFENTKTYFNNESKKSIYFKSCTLKEDIHCGKPLTINIEIYSSINQSVDIALGFRNLQNQPVLHLYSVNSNSVIDLSKGVTKITIKTDNLLLTPGWYSLNLWMGKGEIALDFHKQCLSVNVKGGNINNNSPLVNYKGYNNLINAEWNLQR